jgi:hypothetical protein
MHSIPFDPSLIGTGRIFPPAIESADGIGYHGTSSYYASEIDSGGFSQVKPIPVDDLQRLVTIAVAHKADPDDVKGFLQLKSLSFTPLSELALYFVRPDSFGGQGLLHVTRLLDTLTEKHAAQISTDDAAHIAAVRERIHRIRQAPPVIYAVNLAGLKPMTFGKSSTLATHVYQPIPAAALVAKMIIDKPVDFARIDSKALHQTIRNILYSSGYHYIKQLPP